MHSRRGTMDRWGQVRAAGRVGLAILGGGVFAFLAWPSGPGAGGRADDRGAAISNGSPADGAAGAEVDALINLPIDGRSSALAAIAPEPTRAPIGPAFSEKATARADGRQRRGTGIAVGADRTNQIAKPRGPP